MESVLDNGRSLNVLADSEDEKDSGHAIEDDPLIDVSVQTSDNILNTSGTSLASNGNPKVKRICARCHSRTAGFLTSSLKLITSGNYLTDSDGVKYLENGGSSCSANCARLQTQPGDYEDDDPLINSYEDESAADFAAVPSYWDHCHLPRLNKKASDRAILKLALAAFLTLVFMIGEAVGGWLSGSIAVMSDAAHLLSDLTSFVVSLSAIYLAMQPASKSMSYGYHRAEVLGAVISVLIIWVITGILVYAAVERVITMDFEVEANTMIIVAALGVFINVVQGIILHSSPLGHGHSHGGGQSAERSNQFENVNVRAAFIHILGDLIQSFGVLTAAYIIRYYPEYKIADPICTFAFSVLVMFTTVPILKDLGRVLMEGTPPGVDYAVMISDLTALPGVKMVHSLHVWALTLDKNACSVHLAIGPENDPDTVLRDAQRIIRYNHHIFHTTIQVERYQSSLMDNCKDCQPLT